MELGEPVSPPDVPTPEDVTKCDLCKKPVHPFAKPPGTNFGTGTRLDASIHKGGDKHAHPWYAGGRSLQAHHLICSESMDDDQWAEVCRLFGYDINRKENGVMLPSKMPLACQIIAPLHRGPHEAGSGGGLAYPARIKQLVAKYKSKALGGNYCSNIGQLTADLDSLSTNICSKVDTFAYTLTSDGRDYMPGGKGCGGVTNIPDKTGATCPKTRLHGHTNHAGPIPPKTSSLVVGK